MLNLRRDQGTEWAEYAFQDAAYITRDATGRENWDYQGLHVIGEGSRLRVFVADGTTELWSGVVSFRPPWWRRWYRRTELTPRGIAPENWETWFEQNHPAELG